MVLHLRSRATVSPHMANSRPHKDIPHSNLMTPLRQASMAFLHLSRVIELLLLVNMVLHHLRHTVLPCLNHTVLPHPNHTVLPHLNHMALPMALRPSRHLRL